MTKWMTSGAQRLKANLNRSFGARKNKKAAAHSKDKSYESIVASARIGDARRNNGKLNHQVERLVRSKFAPTTQMNELFWFIYC